ncbi:MAG: ABC transporter ATP-binding protein [bacterium]|nr:ABC transporter ATP-binding protein [bacterium]
MSLGFVWRSAPWLTTTNGILLLVQGVLPLLTLYLTKLVVDAVTVAVTASDKRAALAHIMALVAAMAGVGLVGLAFGAAASVVQRALSLAVARYMQDMVHQKSLEVDLEYYESAQYHDTLYRAQAEAPQRPLLILSNLASFGQSLVALVSMAGLLLMFHWSITLILVAAAIPDLCVRLRFTKKMFGWMRSRTGDERRSQYFSRLITEEPYAREVRMYGLGPWLTDSFIRVRDRLRRERLRIFTRRAFATSGAQSVTLAAVFGAFAFIVWRTVLGAITLGDMVMYHQAFQMARGALQRVLGAAGSLYEDSLFIENLFEFLSLESKVVDPPCPAPVPRPMQQGIRFDHVAFQYPGSDRTVLRDVTLDVRPGEVVALVGPNGAGKTTLIKLLCRLYDPATGAINIDGVDLRELGLPELRSSVSVVFQDFVRYSLTARENIWFGDVQLAQDDPRIVKAAADAGAHGAIAGLPKGYETALGKVLEDGAQLSVGEWQKVALARAFLRDSQIVVLDEPTSAMDARAEYELFSRFRDLLRGRTAILISHRLSTVRMADRIALLEEGRVAEFGSHEELMEAGGRYSALFNLQTMCYQD